MKYIILASLLSTAALAAPFAQQGQANTNAGATQAGAGTAGTQTGAGQTAAGQTQQGGNAQQQGAAQQQGGAAQQQGAQGQTGTGATNAPQQGAGTANGQTPSSGDLATAVSNWMADTSMVSNFLNTGAGISNNVAFKQAATVAFNAEVDELNQKAVIDQANSQQPQVQSANSTLATGGAFQDVVDKLQEMSVKGRAAVQNIDLINQNRCVNVLPNIDAYMASTGSASQAVRPQACDQTGVSGGVQGNGPTQPGDAPGTPQAAFDAASALAAGTGNGVVQNGAPTGAAAQGQAGQGQAAQGQAGQGQAAQGQAGQGQAAQGQAGQQAQGQQAQGQQAQGQAGQGQQAQGQAAQGQQAQGQAGQGQAAQGQQAQGQQAQGQQAQGQAGQGQQAQGQAAQGQGQAAAQ